MLKANAWIKENLIIFWMIF